MKKLFISLFSALLMSAGLIGVSETAATAAPCPYTGCVDTNTNAWGPARVSKGHAATFCVKVTTGGNGAPRGLITMTIMKKRGNFGYTATKSYGAPKRCFGTPLFQKRGFYRVRMHFDGRGSFANSNQWMNFRVTR
jgi:hypothetical protein